MHCINHNVGDKQLVVICNFDTKPQGTHCLFSSDKIPAKRETPYTETLYLETLYYGYRIADYGHMYGDYSRERHVTLYTVFLRGYWKLDTLIILLV